MSEEPQTNVRPRALLVSYSQSGHTEQLAESLCAPIAESERVALHRCPLQPREPYPFPWPFFDFLDAFPETVQLDPGPLAPLELPDDGPWDLVILCYTVWFLSPAPPVTAFLQSPEGRRIVRDAPVVTVISCRNMWMQAHDIVSGMLADAGACHCDNVVFTDPSPSAFTFITTPRWMLTGRRDRFLGMPPAGIGDAAIAGAGRFGAAIERAVADGIADGKTPLLAGLRAVTVNDRLLDSERIGRRSFVIWSRIIRRFGPRGARARKPILAIYSVFLILMIVTVVPVSMLVRAQLRPFQKQRAAAIRACYAQPSGDGGECLETAWQ